MERDTKVEETLSKSVSGRMREGQAHKELK